MTERARFLRRPGKGTLDWAGLVWDVGVMVLVVLNLALIVFDTLFAAEVFADLIGAVSPAFRHWYAHTVHANFYSIDLCFVAIFALDVLIGWAIAIWRQTYHRWFFYPFVHIYDVLGCIPLSGFRWLRVLRLIALTVRLQRLGVINVRHWYVYGVASKYYAILVEELSDRVVANVLGGVQDEVASGGGELSRRVITHVVEPRKAELVTAIRMRAEQTVTRAYEGNREQIRAFVSNMVDRAVSGNTAIAGLERIPMLGAPRHAALNGQYGTRSTTCWTRSWPAWIPTSSKPWFRVLLTAYSTCSSTTRSPATMPVSTKRSSRLSTCSRSR